MNFDTYITYMNINGENFRERQINIEKDGLIKQAKNSPSYFVIDLIRDINLKNKCKREVIITSTTKKTQKNIIALPMRNNDIIAGDIICWNNNDWLILEVDQAKEVYTSGLMSLCNYNLKWQDDSLNILEYPVVVETSSGATIENNLINIGNNQLVIYMKYDENSMKLKRGDRFFIDRNITNPKPYKIKNIDSVKNVIDECGYITLLLEETVLKDEDNIDLMICDYQKVDNAAIVTNKFCHMESNDNSIICDDDIGYILIAKFYNNGKVVQGLTPQWKIVSNDNSKLVINELENTLTIKCFDYSMIGSNVAIELSCKEDETYTVYNTVVCCTSMF